MSGTATIWEIKQRPELPQLNQPLYLHVAIKNTGNTSGTHWLYVACDGIPVIRYRKFGIPPGRIFKWVTIRCGIFQGEPINVHIEAGHGWRLNHLDDTYDAIIDEGQTIYYKAGDDTPAENYRLTTEVNGEGAIDLYPPFGYYAKGTLVKAFAVRQWGYRFEKWTGDLDTTDNPTTIIMDSDKTIIANYKKR